MNRTFLDPGDALTESPVSAAQRKAAAAFCAALLCGAAAVLPFAGAAGDELAFFAPASLAVVFFAGLATAMLLLLQYAPTGAAPLLVLAASFLYASGLAFFELLSDGLLPHAAADGSGLGPRLWALRHGGFALGLAAYAVLLRRPPGARRARRAGTNVAATVAAALAASLAAGCLAASRAGAAGAPDAGAASAAAAAVFALDVVALALLCRTTGGGKTFLQLWLLVCGFASMLDAALTFVSGVPHTAGWYVARLNALVAAGVLLCVFICEMNRLYLRSVRREHELRLANDKLRALSLVDGLTGVANRRRFDGALAEAFASGAARRTSVALLLLDVDFFKRYNDRYGHVAGDEVIRRVAATAEALVRVPDDVVARYGGEEFAVLLPNTDRDAALVVAERIRDAIERLALPHAASERGVVTVSIGAAATLPGEGDAALSPRALVELADAALYEAKRAGRNRVCDA